MKKRDFSICNEINMVKCGPLVFKCFITERLFSFADVTHCFKHALFLSCSFFVLAQGYYDTMDAGFVDDEGFLYIMSRSDDVINVAGHRLSSGALEEVGADFNKLGCFFFSIFFSFLCQFCACCVRVFLQSVLQHPAVGDCAVVGLEDSLKGVVPLALCVLKNGES